MATKLKPGDIKDIALPIYQKTLEKDMARLARVGKWTDFVLITDYKFGGKKHGLLLFADAADKQWEGVVETAKANGKKHAFGKMKVKLMPDANQNGVDDILLVVKTCSEGLTPEKVAEYLAEEMFAKDPDVKAATAKSAGLEDEDDDDSEEKKAENNDKAAQNLSQHSDDIAQNIDAAATASVNKDIAAFADAIKKFSIQVKGVSQLQSSVQDTLKALHNQFEAAKADSSLRTQALIAAQEYFTELDELETAANSVISKGDETLRKINQTAGAVFKTPDFKKNAAFVNEQTQNLRRLLRFLVQAQDFIEDTYLDDHQTEDSSRVEQGLRDAQTFLKAIVQLNAEYQRLKSDPEKASFPLEEILVKIKAYNGLAAEFRRPEAQPKIDNLLQQMQSAQSQVNKARLANGLKLAPDHDDIQAYEDAHTLALSDQPNDWKTAADTFHALHQKYKDSNQIAYVFNEAYKEAQQKYNAFTRAKAFADLITAANPDGQPSAEQLFDVFMSTFRDKITYTPDFIAGSVITGTKSANCENLSAAFAGLLAKANIKAQSVKVASNFITIPVDNIWIDSSAPGNLNTEKFDNSHRYFFDGHWVTEAEGDWFCPTTGRKGKSNVQATIYGTITDKETTCQVSGHNVNFVPAANPSENKGFNYSLESIA